MSEKKKVRRRTNTPPARASPPPSMNSFTIPKRSAQKPLLQETAIESRECKEVLNAVQSSLWSPYSYSIEHRSCHLVHNDKLLDEFKEKRKEMGKDSKTSYAFLYIPKKQYVQEICENGLTTDHVCNGWGLIGDRKFGVYLARCADLINRRTHLDELPSAIIIVFKILMGRLKSLTEQKIDSSVEPTPEYDGHVSKLFQRGKKGTLTETFNFSQIYAYEINLDNFSAEDDTAIFSKRPRQCLPYAVLELQAKRAVIQNIVMAAPPKRKVQPNATNTNGSTEQNNTTNDSDTYEKHLKNIKLLWNGCCYLKEKFLAEVRLGVFNNKLCQSPLSPSTNLCISQKISLEKLSTILPARLFRHVPCESHQPESIVDELCFFHTELHPDNAISDKLHQFHNKLLEKKEAAVCTLSGGAKLYLIPTCEFTDNLGISASYYPAVLHCLFMKSNTASLMAKVKVDYERFIKHTSAILRERCFESETLKLPNAVPNIARKNCRYPFRLEERVKTNSLLTIVTRAYEKRLYEQRKKKEQQNQQQPVVLPDTTNGPTTADARDDESTCSDDLVLDLQQDDEAGCTCCEDPLCRDHLKIKTKSFTGVQLDVQTKTMDKPAESSTSASLNIPPPTTTSVCSKKLPAEESPAQCTLVSSTSTPSHPIDASTPKLTPSEVTSHSMETTLKNNTSKADTTTADDTTLKEVIDVSSNIDSTGSKQDATLVEYTTEKESTTQNVTTADATVMNQSVNYETVDMDFAETDSSKETGSHVLQRQAEKEKFSEEDNDVNTLDDLMGEIRKKSVAKDSRCDVIADLESGEITESDSVPPKEIESQESVQEFPPENQPEQIEKSAAASPRKKKDSPRKKRRSNRSRDKDRRRSSSARRRRSRSRRRHRSRSPLRDAPPRRGRRSPRKSPRRSKSPQRSAHSHSTQKENRSRLDQVSRWSRRNIEILSKNEPVKILNLSPPILDHPRFFQLSREAFESNNHRSNSQCTKSRQNESTQPLIDRRSNLPALKGSSETEHSSIALRNQETTTSTFNNQTIRNEETIPNQDATMQKNPSSLPRTEFPVPKSGVTLGSSMNLDDLACWEMVRKICRLTGFGKTNNATATSANQRNEDRTSNETATTTSRTNETVTTTTSDNITMMTSSELQGRFSNNQPYNHPTNHVTTSVSTSSVTNKTVEIRITSNTYETSTSCVTNGGVNQSPTASQDQLPNTASQYQLPNTVTQAQLTNAVTQDQLPNAVTQDQLPNAVTQDQLPNIVTDLPCHSMTATAMMTNPRLTDTTTNRPTDTTTNRPTDIMTDRLNDTKIDRMIGITTDTITTNRPSDTTVTRPANLSLDMQVFERRNQTNTLREAEGSTNGSTITRGYLSLDALESMFAHREIDQFVDSVFTQIGLKS